MGNTLSHYSRHTIVVQEVREKWWRVHESTVRVGEDHARREDIVGIGTTDIETRLEEWTCISIHASIEAKDRCSCLVIESTEISATTTR